MLNSLFKTLFLLGNHTCVYEPMLHDHIVIIQNWHMVEESYDHGKMVVSFFDKPTIFIDNSNEQKFLMCCFEGRTLHYTHIESFVNDFAHHLNNVRHILIDECDGKNKRKLELPFYNCCMKRPRKM